MLKNTRIITFQRKYQCLHRAVIVVEIIFDSDTNSGRFLSGIQYHVAGVHPKRSEDLIQPRIAKGTIRKSKRLNLIDSSLNRRDVQNADAVNME